MRAKSKLIPVLLSLALAVGLWPGAALAKETQLQVAVANAESGAKTVLSLQASGSGYVKSAARSGKCVYVARVGKKTFKAVPYASEDGMKYKLQVKAKGKTRILAKSVDECFVTNGRYVFYAKRGKNLNPMGVAAYKNTVYRLDLRNGARKRVASGKNCFVDACNGRYLYYTRGMDQGTGGALCALRVSTWKRTRIAGGLCRVSFVGSRIVVRQGSQNYGYAVYSMRQNGSDRKTIASSVADYKVKGARVVYMEADSDYSGTWYRVCRCGVGGKGRKVLSGWTSDWSSADRAFRRYAG